MEDPLMFQSLYLNWKKRMDFSKTAEPDPSINHDEPTVYIDLFKYPMLGSKCGPFTILYCSIGQELSKVYISKGTAFFEYWFLWPRHLCTDPSSCQLTDACKDEWGSFNCCKEGVYCITRYCKPRHGRLKPALQSAHALAWSKPFECDAVRGNC